MYNAFFVIIYRTEGGMDSSFYNNRFQTFDLSINL